MLLFAVLLCPFIIAHRYRKLSPVLLCSVPCLIAVALDRIRAQRILSLDISGPGLLLLVVSGKGRFAHLNFWTTSLAPCLMFAKFFPTDDDSSEAVTGGRSSSSLSVPLLLHQRVFEYSK